jgi:predicted ArsR family transcriptional regulator
MAKRQTPKDWISAQAVGQALGMTPKHLYRLRDEGLLKAGFHYRNIARPQAARPTYRWHLVRIEQALELPQELR